MICVATFDVQNMTVKANDNKVCIRCIFASGSQADGCGVSNDTGDVFNIVLRPDKSVAFSEEECFSISQEQGTTIRYFVYDMDNGVNLNIGPFHTFISFLIKAVAY